ncbi:MAG: hypothetical protein ACREQJ_09745, partial [Candidatus Binatia bacterium]
AGPIVMPWLAAIFLTLAVWPARNVVVLGDFFPGSSDGLRMVWATTVLEGDAASRERAWRETSWREPDATESERNRRLEHEVLERARTRPGALAASAAARALHVLDLPRFPTSLEGGTWLGTGSAIAFWLASRLGAAGIVLALFRRFTAGLLLGGTFCSLLAFQALVSDDPQTRLPDEWLWLVGAAYLLVMLPRFHREPLLSIDAVDGDRDPPLYRTLLDRPSVGAPILGLIALPFLAVGLVAPLRQGALAATPAATIAEPAGPSVADLFAHAKTQPGDAIVYPAEAVLWTGELSHLVAREDGALGSFSFKPGKRGLAVGDAQVPCTVPAGVSIPLPDGALRRSGTVIATIAGTGALGEPVLAVSEIRWE